MYLFFVRAFNDIDHVTPIVWKMGRDRYPAAVYCISPEYDYRNDYRLKFLQEMGVAVGSIYDSFDQNFGIVHRAMRFFVEMNFALHRRLDANARWSCAAVRDSLRVFTRIAGKQLYKLTRKRFYDVGWARRIIEHTGARILCFDWVGPERYVVGALLAAAKEKGIPAVALPHGVYLYTNDLVKADLTEDKIRVKYNCYDRVVVQNNLFKKVMEKSGVKKDKIVVLGSARYCNEWMVQYKKILPRVMQSRKENSGRLKVVFMTTRTRYRVKVEETIRTFGLLSRMEGIDVLVKPHTRTGKDVCMYKNLPLANMSEVSSVELCEWADVVLVVGSSIVVEALKLKKPVLYLKYLHENVMEYEEFGACWTIRDDAELQQALVSLQQDKTRVPYSDEKVTRWLCEIVYGGGKERDVLQDYEDFIVACADRKFAEAREV